MAAETTSASNNQEYEILSPYFPKHLDNDKYRQARKTKTGANFILAGLQSYIAQMEGSFPEWKGLFTIRQLALQRNPRPFLKGDYIGASAE